MITLREWLQSLLLKREDWAGRRKLRRKLAGDLAAVRELAAFYESLDPPAA